MKLALIQCYAPTSVAQEMVKKKEFYTALQETVELEKEFYTITMGDVKAKVREGFAGEFCIGAYDLGIRNQEGARLIDFAR